MARTAAVRWRNAATAVAAGRTVPTAVGTAVVTIAVVVVVVSAVV